MNVGRCFVECVVFFAIWLLFVDRIQFAEMVIGVAVSAFAVMGTEGFRASAKIRAELPAHWFQAFLAAARNALIEAAKLMISPRKRGRFLCVPFESPERGASGATRSALVIALTSISANSIVIDVDPHRKMLLIHQAIPAPAPDVIHILEGR